MRGCQGNNLLIKKNNEIERKLAVNIITQEVYNIRSD